MPVAPDLIDPFHKVLYKRLSQEIQERTASLVSGAASRIIADTETVAEKYAAQVAYLRALSDVLEVCEELERERYGERAGRQAD